MADHLNTEGIDPAEAGEVQYFDAEVGEVDGQPPAVPPVVRTVAYFALLAVSALVLLCTGLAPIWLDGEVATRVVASGGVVSSVIGVIAGGLGVAYRPTR